MDWKTKFKSILKTRNLSDSKLDVDYVLKRVAVCCIVGIWIGVVWMAILVGLTYTDNPEQEKPSYYPVNFGGASK